MGKKDLSKLYKAAKRQNGVDSCKSSYFCDEFEPNEDYAGLVIYAVDGSFKWRNNSGVSSGYKGQAFQLIIVKSSKLERYFEGGCGRVHVALLKYLLGDVNPDNVMCTGFAIARSSVRGAQPILRFSSVVMNGQNQKGVGGETDGSKYCSQLEQELVTYMVGHWKANGKHKIFAFPYSLQRKLQ